MTLQETGVIMRLLKTAYPSFYSKQSIEEQAEAVKVWTYMFDEPFQVVNVALKEVIGKGSPFPPAIGEIKEVIRRITASSSGEPTNEEYWNILKQAVSNSAYGSVQEYDKLPPLLQRYVCSPKTLQEWSTLEEGIFNTVTKGQFNKNFEIIKERETLDKKLSPDVRKFISDMTKPMQIESKTLTTEELNARKNEIISKLQEGKTAIANLEKVINND